jgi:hypothetical protein
MRDLSLNDNFITIMMIKKTVFRIDRAYHEVFCKVDIFLLAYNISYKPIVANCLFQII